MATNEHLTISDDDSDILELENFVISDDESDSLEWSSVTQNPKSPVSKTLRNGPIRPPYVCDSQLKLPSLPIIRPLDTVELQTSTTNAKGETFLEFLHVKSILRNVATDEVILRGLLLHRNNCLDGVLPLRLNEVHVVVKVEYEDYRPFLIQGMIDVPAENVFKKRILKLTNKDFPAESWREHTHLNDNLPGASEARRSISSNLELTCRWIYVICCAAPNSRRDLRRRDFKAIMRLSEAECGEGRAVANKDLKRQFRAGGSGRDVESNLSDERAPIESEADIQPHATNRGFMVADLPSGHVVRERVVDLTGDRMLPSAIAETAKAYNCIDNPQLRKRPCQESHNNRICTIRSPRQDSQKAAKQSRPGETHIQKYIFLDTFAGAGGVSRGAHMAGYRVTEAFDSDLCACESYRRNFPDVEPWVVSADEFVRIMADSNFFVAVVHFSPPCQGYSRMNRTRYSDSDRNDMNKDARTCVSDILLLRRPRVITVEQTDGLLDFPDDFHSLIRMMVDCGYSVRWKVMRFEEYGLAQKRRRLIIIASCPGEVLPNFPKPTHSDDRTSGLLPLVTIKDAIDAIPPGWPDHDVEGAKRRDPRDPRYLPYPADRQSGTILTGGRGYHPSGTRDFTLRELACLQGFPLCHQFAGTKTAIRRQIGNAFSPIVVKALYDSIAKSLRKADELEQ